MTEALNGRMGPYEQRGAAALHVQTEQLVAGVVVVIAWTRAADGSLTNWLSVVVLDAVLVARHRVSVREHIAQTASAVVPPLQQQAQQLQPAAELLQPAAG